MRRLTLEQLTREDVAFVSIRAARHFWPHGNSTLYQGEGRKDNMVFFQLEGRRRYRFADPRETLEVGPNDLMLMPAASCYESTVLSEEGSSGICLQFSLIDGAGARCCLGDRPVLLRQNSEGLRALLESIQRSALQYGSRLRVQALMLELFSILCASPLAWDDAELQPAIQYMEEHLERPVAVGEAAERCHMSVSTFSRRFRALRGESPAAFHRHMRLKKGRELLASGLYTVEQTALTLGFFDTAHFCRAYAACFGSPPGSARSRPLSQTRRPEG